MVDNPALISTFMLQADTLNNLCDDTLVKNHLISVMMFGRLFLK
jgi:hypothetical protein